MAWSATITGVNDVAPELQAAVDEGTKSGLEALGVKGAEMVQENIRTPYGNLPPAVAFGNLVSSVISTYQAQPAGKSVVIGVSDQLQASAYAAPVETGARPHMPPASALVAWVQKKFDVNDEKTATGIAFAIAKKISQRGTEGHEMFARALTSLDPIAAGTLEHYIAEALMLHGFVPLEGLA